jgi:hypothetical protein
MCAAWAEYWACIGRGQITGREVPDDVHSSRLVAAALNENPASFIEQPYVFGDLATDVHFREPYLDARRSLVESGMHAMLDILLGR